MAVIQFNAVTKSYRRNKVLDGVTFEVPEGVVFALLGDNGAGKTTSIKSMLGLVQPDSGSIKVLGLDVKKDDLEIRRRVGFVPEQPQLYEWMGVDQIGWFAAGFHGADFFANYRRYIDEFEIPLGKKISELSKGMRAKVSLSLALAHDPDLLILDEPTSGLDPLVRRQFLESMVDRASQGRTVFLSSHQISEVERIADYVALLHDGKLLFVESMDDLKQATRELLVTVREQGVPLPQMNTPVICSHRSGRQWRVLTRNVSVEDLAAIRAHDFVDHCEARTPSLEEIFVGYLGRQAVDVNHHAPDVEVAS
jgi:ABC-2 type transport system ATP-binding protein